MKNKKLRLKWGIFAYLLIFTAITLIILWCLEVISLDSFYKAIKTHSVKNAATYVCKNINDENLDTLVRDVSEKNEVYIMISDASGKIICSPNVLTGMNLRIPEHQLKDFISLLDENKNELLNEIDRNTFRSSTMAEENNKEFPTPTYESQKEFNNSENNKLQNEIQYRREKISTDNNSIVYVTSQINNDNEKLIIFVTTNIIPVDATVNTIRWQLCIVSLVMIVLALILALIISGNISREIVDINEKSKEFSKGNYDVKFNAGMYKELSELSETLNLAAKDLSKVDEIRREFIANVSHDLRTPLTMITGYSEAIRDLPGEDTKENIQVVIDEAKRLTSLVNDLLDVTRIQSGAFEIENAEYNLTKSIKEIIHRYDKLLSQKGYKIKFSYDKEIIVNADELRISQVIYNFINNAITHAGGEKNIDIKQTADNKYVKIEVIDYGKGIEKEKLKDIWNRYYKIDKEHKRAQVGTGLGLSIISEILKLYDSDYGVESEVNKGSNFWFKLRYVKSEKIKK